MRTTSRIEDPEKNREFQTTQRKEKFEGFKKMREERYNEIRNLKNSQKKKLEQQNNNSLRDNMYRHNKILEDKEKAKERIREMNERKLSEIRQMRLKVYMDEEKIKRKKEADILKMEKLEMELISKLQSSQLRQKNAYEELESALTLPAKEFEQKYLAGESEEQLNKDLKEMSGERKYSRDDVDSHLSSQNKLDQMLENGNLPADIESETNFNKRNLLVEKIPENNNKLLEVNPEDDHRDSENNEVEKESNTIKKSEKEGEDIESKNTISNGEKVLTKSPLNNEKQEASFNEEK